MYLAIASRNDGERRHQPLFAAFALDMHDIPAIERRRARRQAQGLADTKAGPVKQQHRSDIACRNPFRFVSGFGRRKRHRTLDRQRFRNRMWDLRQGDLQYSAIFQRVFAFEPAEKCSQRRQRSRQGPRYDMSLPPVSEESPERTWRRAVRDRRDKADGLGEISETPGTAGDPGRRLRTSRGFAPAR